jgi:hypothetical protein
VADKGLSIPLHVKLFQTSTQYLLCAILLLT